VGDITASSNGAAMAAAIAALRAHPRFTEAIRASARGIIELHRRSRLMSWFMSDRPLAIIGYAVIYLHAHGRDDDMRSGLTPSRFKDFCRDTGLCSPGRAGAILAFMRLTGHLEAIAHPADRRITRLQPSEKLLDMLRSRLARQFAAIVMVRPDIAPAIERIGRPEFERALSRFLGDWYRAGTRIIDHAPTMRLFAERDAGVLILLSLMLAGGQHDAPVPAGPAPVSIAALARQFRVSRTHVLRLIRDAEAAGLMTRTGSKGEKIIVSLELRDDLQNLLAGVFHVLATAAVAALSARASPLPN